MGHKYSIYSRMYQVNFWKTAFKTLKDYGSFKNFICFILEYFVTYKIISVFSLSKFKFDQDFHRLCNALFLVLAQGNEICKNWNKLVVISQAISDTLLFWKDWDLFVNIRLIVDWWLLGRTITSPIHFVWQKRWKKFVQFWFSACVNIEISHHWKVCLFWKYRITRKYSFMENYLCILSAWLENNLHNK